MMVKINFYGLGYNNINQAFVTIYDEYNNVVFEGKTHNNHILVNLCRNNVYKLIACSLGEEINTYFYVNSDNYCFRFNYNMIDTNNKESNLVTFILTDYFYDNLKIERGEIILWQSQ